MLQKFRVNYSANLIGVHVRRTDYKDLLGEDKYPSQGIKTWPGSNSDITVPTTLPDNFSNAPVDTEP